MGWHCRTCRRLVACARLAVLTGTFALVAVAAPSARAEDPCPPDAPRHVAAVQGHTWSGSVVSADEDGPAKLGVQPWVIVFDIDKVFADRHDAEVPTASIEPNQRFELPSNTCGRPGDMGLRPGHRYLISTSSFGDGTSIGSIIAWEIGTDGLTLVPGMFKTSAVGPQFAAVKTLDQALALLVPKAVVATPIADSPTAGSVASPRPVDTTSGEGIPSVLAFMGILVAVTGLALGSEIVLLARRRGGRSGGGNDA